MNESKLITPRKLAGFWELPPEKEILFEQMQEKIKKVFENNCFVPLDTPVLELSEILLAKSSGEMDKELFAFTKGSTSMCMRYDLTVPLARFVAANANTLEFPFKRYQIGKNYRGERPQRGRFREFYQCDADIIGSETLSMVADAECVKLYLDCFDALGYPVVVEISNRNLLFGLIEDFGDSEKAEDIIILLDKFDKIGEESLISSLAQLGISSKNIDKYVSAIKVKGNFKEIQSKLSPLSNNDTFKKAIAELEEVEQYLTAFGCDKEGYIYNVGIIRGHNYYTGTVFEAYLKGRRDLPAFGGGGRYDNLAGYFTDKKLPGVGMSIGLTRMFDLLDQNGLLPEIKKSNIDLFIIPLGDYTPHCVSLCSYFRSNGIKAEVAYDSKSFKSKMKEADRRQIPFVMVVGENEVNSGTYALKNMSTGTQTTLTKEECLNELKR
ncbi:MAG: histidine--tRNA ligase [Clostridia bacterium]|nr:histidine--tRNA ligase [Clostridia bacterium]